MTLTATKVTLTMTESYTLIHITTYKPSQKMTVTGPNTTQKVTLISLRPTMMKEPRQTLTIPPLELRRVTYKLKVRRENTKKEEKKEIN